MVEWINAARIGLAGLTVHKFRAALSMLGIIFGVASVVAVIAVSEGARGEVLKQLAALGASNIMVDDLDWRASSEKRDLKKQTRLHSAGLTVEEADAIARSCSLISNHAPLRKVQASIRLDEQPVNAEVIGTTPAYADVMGLRLQKGRWLTATDDALARRVCVIDDTIRQEYFRLSSALGRAMVIDHEPYEVVGIIENVEPSSDSKYSVDDVKQLNRRIYIPLQAALSRTTLDPLSDEVSRVIFQCVAPERVHEAAAVLGRHYEASHNMASFAQGARDYAVSVAGFGQADRALAGNFQLRDGLLRGHLARRRRHRHHEHHARKRHRTPPRNRHAPRGGRDAIGHPAPVSFRVAEHLPARRNPRLPARRRLHRAGPQHDRLADEMGLVEHVRRDGRLAARRRDLRNVSRVAGGQT